MRLNRDFFERNTIKVALDLLGKFLVRKYKNKLLIGKIVETEAYIGPYDKASHAYSKKEQPLKIKSKILKENWKRIKNYINNPEIFKKRILNCRKCKVTSRNLAEYLRGGHIYIYLVYGNYYQLNITTYKEGYPECVLIRSLEPILNLKNPKGPGNLCKELYLDSSFWGEDLTKSKRIWLENETKLGNFAYNKSKFKIIKAKRIGIDYAEEYKDKLWRFYIKDNKWVSKK